MKAYFALLFLLMALIVAPILNTAVNALSDAGDALTTTTTTRSSDWVELIPPLVITR